ncbi:MarR family winged helix-turn-helix transcriptional regulator [Streptomyces sp. NPDC058619]
MRALAQLLGAAGASMTRLCDRLEAAGFLRRHPCPGDGREVTLRLTPAGEKHLAEIRETRERRLALALGAMSADSRRALAALKNSITATTELPAQESQPAAWPATCSTAHFDRLGDADVADPDPGRVGWNGNAPRGSPFTALTSLVRLSTSRSCRPVRPGWPPSSAAATSWGYAMALFRLRVWALRAWAVVG